MLRVVLDTNVLVAGLRSTHGASHAVLAEFRAGTFTAVVSNSLCFEYLDLLSRPEMIPSSAFVTPAAWLDGFLKLAARCQVRFRWRPSLSDPDDELVLEAALAGSVRYLVTHNVADFSGATSLGIQPMTPRDFLAILRQT